MYQRTRNVNLESRHLGLVQSVEVNNLKNKIDYLSKLIEENIDLDAIIESFKEVRKFEDKYHLNSRIKELQ